MAEKKSTVQQIPLDDDILDAAQKQLEKILESSGSAIYDPNYAGNFTVSYRNVKFILWLASVQGALEDAGKQPTIMLEGGGEGFFVLPLIARVYSNQAVGKPVTLTFLTMDLWSVPLAAKTILRRWAQ